MAKNVYIPIVTKFDKSGVDQAGGALDGLGKTLGKFAGVVAAAFSVRAISDFVKESIGAAEAVQQANNRIANIAESMNLFGEQTGAVSDRLIEFAESKELNLGVDAEIIKAAQAQLLTFANLAESADEAGGAFDRATVASADLAAAGFGSMDSASVALGKALQDPVGGITALRKAAVTFTDDQKALIESFVEAGDMASAQNIILEAVEQQVGGTAEATATASEKIALAFGNIKEEVGAALLPVFEQLAPVLIQFASTVGPILASAFTALTPVLTQIVEMLPGILNSFMPLIPVVGELAGIFLNLAALVLPVFANLLTTLAPIILLIANAFLQFITAVLTPLMPLIDGLITLFGQVIGAILPPLLDLVLALVPVFMDLLVTAIMPLVPVVVSLVQALLPLILKIFPLLAQLVAAVLPPLMTLFTSIITPLIPVVMMLVNAFLPLIDQVLPLLLQALIQILPVFIQLLNMVLMPLIPIIQVVAGIISNQLAFAFNMVANVLTFLMPIIMLVANLFSAILGPAINLVSGFFTSMGEIFAGVGEEMQNVWDNVGNFFRDIANSMIGYFEGFINFVIEGVNNFLQWLDDVGQAVQDATGGAFGFDVTMRVNKVSLPRLAEGGLVMPQTGGVLAMLAEAGQPEAVIPLDRLGEFGGGGNVVNVTINAGIGTDPVSLGRTVVNAIKRYETTSGRVFLNV